MKANMEARNESSPRPRKQREKLRKAIAFKIYEFDCHGVEMNQRYVSERHRRRTVRRNRRGARHGTLLSGDDLAGRTTAACLGVRSRRGRNSTLDLTGQGDFTVLTGIGGEAWVRPPQASRRDWASKSPRMSLARDGELTDHVGDWAGRQRDRGKRLSAGAARSSCRVSRRSGDGQRRGAAVGGNEANSFEGVRLKPPPGRKPMNIQPIAKQPNILTSRRRVPPQVVNARMAADADPRLRQVMSAIVRHLHAAVKEIEPTHDEWLSGDRIPDRHRPHVHRLAPGVYSLSDTLGVSMLVDAINNRKPMGPDENNDPRSILCRRRAALRGRRQYFARRQRRTAGRARPRLRRPGQADRRRENRCLAGQRRRLLRRAAEGRAARHESARPVHGRWRRQILVPIRQSALLSNSRSMARSAQLLQRMGRHPNRAAHLHLIVTAPGFETVVTHIFTPDCPYLDEDAVFGVKESLIADFKNRRSQASEALGCPIRSGWSMGFRSRESDMNGAPGDLAAVPSRLAPAWAAPAAFKMRG